MVSIEVKQPLSRSMTSEFTNLSFISKLHDLFCEVGATE